MDELKKLNDFLLQRFQWYTELIASADKEGKHQTAFNFKCTRDGIIEIIDEVNHRIEEMRKEVK